MRTERSKRVIGLKMPKKRPFLALQANYPLDGIHRQSGNCPLDDPQGPPKQVLLVFSTAFGAPQAFLHYVGVACSSQEFDYDILLLHVLDIRHGTCRIDKTKINNQRNVVK